MTTKLSFNGVRYGAVFALLAMFLSVNGGCNAEDYGDLSAPEGPSLRPQARAVIYYPSDGWDYMVGDTVSFLGRVENAPRPEDLPDSYFTWTSSIQGVLGTGREFERDDLVEGDHTVTLTVRDESGFKIEDSVVIHILSAGTGAVVLEDDFDDGSPVDGRWRRELAYSAGGVTDSVSHESTGGNPDGYRYMVHAFPDSGQISVWHFYTGGVYVPGEQGAISHVIYQEDRVHIDKPTPSAAIGTLFVAKQGGTVYYAPVSPGNAFSNEVWERLVTPALAATDFSPSGLDFSAAGDTITFGYLRSNTNHGHVALTLKHGIDNWRVEVHRQTP